MRWHLNHLELLRHLLRVELAVVARRREAQHAPHLVLVLLAGRRYVAAAKQPAQLDLRQRLVVVRIRRADGGPRQPDVGAVVARQRDGAPNTTSRDL